MKKTLPVAGKAVPSPVKDYAAEDRKYAAQDALRTLARAEEIRKDKALMRDVKAQAKAITKAVCK